MEQTRLRTVVPREQAVVAKTGMIGPIIAVPRQQTGVVEQIIVQKPEGVVQIKQKWPVILPTLGGEKKGVTPKIHLARAVTKQEVKDTTEIIKECQDGAVDKIGGIIEISGKETQIEIRRMQEEYANSIIVMTERIEDLNEKVDRLSEQLRRALRIKEEDGREGEEEEEEEISTTGERIMTKERGERLSEEETRILLNRIRKNITTYEQMHRIQKQEQIRNMKENKRILTEIQEARRKVKRGTAIKI